MLRGLRSGLSVSGAGGGFSPSLPSSRPHFTLFLSLHPGSLLDKSDKSAQSHFQGHSACGSTTCEQTPQDPPSGTGEGVERELS